MKVFSEYCVKYIFVRVITCPYKPCCEGTGDSDHPLETKRPSWLQILLLEIMGKNCDLQQILLEYQISGPLDLDRMLRPYFGRFQTVAEARFTVLCLCFQHFQLSHKGK